MNTACAVGWGWWGIFARAIGEKNASILIMSILSFALLLMLLAGGYRVNPLYPLFLRLCVKFHSKAKEGQPSIDTKPSVPGKGIEILAGTIMTLFLILLLAGIYCYQYVLPEEYHFLW